MSRQDTYDESTMLDIIKDYIDPDGQNLLGWNEDAVAIQYEGKIMILNTDSWVASTDKPKDISYYSCGFRALVNSASDIIAKGSSPLYAVVSISASKKYYREIPEIVRGISVASKINKIHYLGGDLNSSEDLVIDVTTWGFADTKLRKRKNAKEGEFVYWLGPSLGEISAALGILTLGWKGDKDIAKKLFETPKLYPEFLSYNASSSIDCSDGLAKSLYHLSESSRVRIELDGFIANEWVIQVAKDNLISLHDLILYGGEELGVVFTSQIDYPDNDDLVKIGRVLKGDAVIYKREIIENRGWTHFSNS